MRKQDLSVLFFHYLGYSRLRLLLSRFQGVPLTRFVTFHDVLPAAEPDFRAQLQYLKSATQVVSLQDFVAGKLSLTRLNVVITFDDGYKSWITTAAPLLKQLGLPAVFFVTSGFVDLNGEDQTRFVRERLRTNPKTTGGMSSAELKTLAEQGFTIGGHTFNHVDLTKMQDPAAIASEVATDKENLERITGRPIDYFAFPFGESHNPAVDVAAILKRAGYRAAVTLIPGFNTKARNPYSLLREVTGTPMSLSIFKARVCGAYDAVNSTRKLLGLKAY